MNSDRAVSFSGVDPVTVRVVGHLVVRPVGDRRPALVEVVEIAAAGHAEAVTGRSGRRTGVVGVGRGLVAQLLTQMVVEEDVVRPRRAGPLHRFLPARPPDRIPIGVVRLGTALSPQLVEQAADWIGIDLVGGGQESGGSGPARRGPTTSSSTTICVSSWATRPCPTPTTPYDDPTPFTAWGPTPAATLVSTRAARRRAARHATTADYTNGHGVDAGRGGRGAR